MTKFKGNDDYDKYLSTIKKNRLVRLDDFCGMSKGIKHQCTDKKCARIWKPSPSMVINDDYYCPSCVLHHRNNVNRFKIERLKWTKDVPNTFYLFKITDPKDNKSLIKFGRTQHKDSHKRYVKKERDEYKMKLVKQWRGRLEDTTIAENWWKEQADTNDLYQRFSNDDFHGATECIDVDDNTFKNMVKHTEKLINGSSNDTQKKVK